MGMLSEEYVVSVFGGEERVGNDCCGMVGVGVWEDSIADPTSSELFLRFATLLFNPTSLPSSFLRSTGLDSPRSLPRLATPTPHVNVVLYPEHSFPISMHGVQYGRFRSQPTARFWHVKQSSWAPPAPVLLLLFFGGAVVGATSCTGSSLGAAVMA